MTSEETDGVMQEIASRTDWELIQALNQAKAFMDRESRSGDDWDRLHTAVDTALRHITGATSDVSYVKGGDEGLGDRFERPAHVSNETMDRARGALMALVQRPDEDQVGHALGAVGALNDELERT
ncbi:MAG: hypothetical protein R3320_03170 [Nitriliruptorales bacterium]|nr:hypothetical protein [Nitriliruptorales bacterium]